MIGYTIVAGFLGAGKTSLIRGLLATATQRLGVIVNDLGELSLDAALLRASPSASDEAIIELASGCVCCTVGDSLAVSLRDLALHRPSPQRIVVECSGVADPSRVAAYGSRRVLEEPQVICVVDCTDLCERANDPRFEALVDAQLAAADLVVLSKTDLADTAAQARVRQLLAERCGQVPLLVGRPDELGTALFPLLGQQEALQQRTKRSDLPIEQDVTATTVHADASWTLADVAKMCAAIPALVRAKGLLVSDAETLVVQWAAGRLETEPWHGAPPQRSWLTLIEAAT